MMMVVMVLLQVVVGLLVETMSTGRASKKMRSEFVGLFSFLLFWCFMPKGEKIREVNNFLTPWRGCYSRSFMFYPMRVVFVR